MSEKSKVYYGSTIAGQPHRFANMASKLDKILEQLDLSSIEKKDKVAVKMHLGFNDGYQTVPVFFVRRVVEAIKKQGAYPFVTDNPTAVYNAAYRGYTQETCGCPIIPIAGVKDGYTTEMKIDFQGLKSLDAAGVLLDADVLVNLTHCKGHGNCGYGGAFKNIALGGYSRPTRWHKLHGVVQHLQYYDSSKMTKEHLEKIRKACPRDAPRWSEQSDRAVLAFYACDQCHGMNRPCEDADDGTTGWSVNKENFYAFQELMAIAAEGILETFDEDKRFHLNFMTDITPFCDCMGMGMPNVIEDVGIAASRDIVAVEFASLDLIAQQGLNEDTIRKIPEAYMRINLEADSDLHPFQRLHGPYKNPYKVAKYGAERGLGSKEYELIEVLSAEETANMDAPEHQYEGGASFF